MTICNADHCPNRAVRRGYCDEHAREQGRAKSKRRGYSAHAAGYDAKWERTKARFKRAHPICNRCDQPTEDVHHVDGLGPKGPRGHDPLNLEALCKHHHGQVTRASQRPLTSADTLKTLQAIGRWMRDTPTQG
jgi:5-methylcytosine-specific restriction protein A